MFTLKHYVELLLKLYDWTFLIRPIKDGRRQLQMRFAVPSRRSTATYYYYIKILCVCVCDDYMAHVLFPALLQFDTSRQFLFTFYFLYIIHRSQSIHIIDFV